MSSEPGPSPEKSPAAAAVAARSRWRTALGIAAALAGVALLIVLTALPHGTELSETVPLTSVSPHTIEIDADRANVTVVLTDAPATQFTIEGELHGFGLLTAQLGASLETTPPPAPELRYHLAAQGWLTDVDGYAVLHIPARAFERVRVWVRRGDIHVVDASRARVVRSGTVELQLTTGQGTVERSERPPAA